MDTITIDFLANLKKNDTTFRHEPSYQLTRALTEYTPGNEVIIDGWSYRSAGITMKSSWSESRIFCVQACIRCGYQHIIEPNDSHARRLATCPHCHQDSMRGIRMSDIESTIFTEVVEPAGFAVDIYEDRTRKVTERSAKQHVEPLLLGMEPWRGNGTGFFELREGTGNSEILYYNTGNGQGFSVCFHCGRADVNPQRLTDHRRLRGGGIQVALINVPETAPQMQSNTMLSLVAGYKQIFVRYAFLMRIIALSMMMKLFGH